ncbi:MAG TPA: hypothetical protein VGF86_10220 [Candidatus Tumulicola sp.]|jgi:SAM-dependent methyltransferase
MPPSSPPDDHPIRPGHPLALGLIGRLKPRSRILDFCTGSGRNAAALAAAGYDVVRFDDAAAQRNDPLPRVPGGFAAVVSTHGLLHGTAREIAELAGSLANVLACDGLFVAAFGSAADARFGQGLRLSRQTFAPADGDERGVAHTYFTRAELEAILAKHLVIESLEEVAVDSIAGTWAHAGRPLENAVHWFLVARRPAEGTVTDQ